MNIQGAHPFNQVTSLTQSQPVVDHREEENDSKVFSSVDETPKSDSSHNDPSQQSSESNDFSKKETEQQQQTQNELEQRKLKQDQAEIQKLKVRDTEVRQHEAAHAAVGGSFAGSPSYEFQAGPDGRRYAVGGEVKISTSKVADDPARTLQKAAKIKAAALAPAEPSAQDRRVAAQADQMSVEARADILTAKQSELKEAKEESTAEEDSDAKVGDVEGAGDNSKAESPTLLGTPESEKNDRDELGLTDSSDLVARLVELGVLNEAEPVGGLLNLTA
ncbi:MAG: hypothetical protein JKY67_01680 [Pseudomonadales bacterium]|nr:hypothetical protein [Pseudomonadales bacterium]